MAYARITDKEGVLVVFNNDTKPVEVSFDVSMIKQFPPNSYFINQLSNIAAARFENGKVKVSLPARTAGIFRNQLIVKKLRKNESFIFNRLSLRGVFDIFGHFVQKSVGNVLGNAIIIGGAIIGAFVIIVWLIMFFKEKRSRNKADFSTKSMETNHV